MPQRAMSVYIVICVGIPKTAVHVWQVKFVAAWRALLTLAYDNCLRVYDTVTEELRFTWENENRCPYTAVEVNTDMFEVRRMQCAQHAYVALVGNRLGLRGACPLCDSDLSCS